MDGIDTDKFKATAAMTAEKVLLTMIHGAEKLVRSESLNMAGATPHDIIYTDDLLSVLHYKPLEEEMVEIAGRKQTVQSGLYKTPLVLVPPLLAPGFAFDLYPSRSIARYFVAKGFDVYLVDFGSPDKSHSHLTFEDYILRWIPDAMASIRKESGQEELSLFGYCLGGLFSLLYTAASMDENIKNIITVASPIDMHQMGAAGKVLSIVSGPAMKLSRIMGFSLMNLDPKYTHIPGILGTIGFNLTNPFGFVKSHWDLMLNLWDREYVVAYESMGHWLNNLLDYPGATMQDMIVQMGMGNILKRGGMQIGNKHAFLKDVKCSILAFAGLSDEVVPIDSADNLLEVVSSTDKTFYKVPGGHMGIMMGSKAPENLWDMSAEWLSTRSNKVEEEIPYFMKDKKDR